MNCNTTHYRANSSSVPGDPTRAVCAPCGEYHAATCECRILRRGGDWFRQLFEHKPCEPHLFLERFLRRRVLARLGPTAADHVPDMVSESVLSLFRNPPRNLPVHNVIALRKLLAGRAQRVLIDYWRGVKGRTRCGNCQHHEVGSDRSRRCGHPDTRHAWRGKEVPAAEDPRGFDPPCGKYSSRRETVSEAVAGVDPLANVAAADRPDEDAAGSERAAILLDCLTAVQRQDARAAFVLLQTYFKNATNEDVAARINATVRTVSRAKEKGLDLLRAEFTARGVQLQDLV